MSYYRRNLPHWHPEGKCIFLTWRLYGSLPVGFIRGLRMRLGMQSAEEFRLAEQLLDRPTDSPLWLKEPRIAAAIVETLISGAFELHHYDLHAYVVMANHVHVLLSPLMRLRLITRELKGITARQSNSILGRTGKRFWQDECFDHWVRNEAQFVRLGFRLNPWAAAWELILRPPFRGLFPGRHRRWLCGRCCRSSRCGLCTPM